MRSIVKNTGKLIIASIALCLSMNGAFANTLSEVEVYQNGAGYGIALKTDSVAQMKKVTSSSDRMTVLLKDVKVSENFNTVYNNVAKMDNVTVQQSGKNDIRIVFKGKGVSNSKVSFASASTNAAYPQTQSIHLNPPVSSYSPVYNPEDFVVEEEPTQTSNPQLNEILTQMHISREMLLTVKRYAKSAIKKAKNLANGDMNVMTVFGILLIAAAFMLKPRRKSANLHQDRIMQKKSLELPHRANIEREIRINQDLADNMNLKPSVNGNYGVKAYQQSQRNPYMSAKTPSTNGVSGIARRKPISSSNAPQAMPKPVTKESAPLKSAVSKNVNSPISSQKPKMQQLSDLKKSSPLAKSLAASTPKQQEIDSMKFLESITKIYENSGRTDLAKGLKDNLRKAQLTQI